MNSLLKRFFSWMHPWRGEWSSPFFVFLGCALLIVTPLFFRSGFIFLLDVLSIPQNPFPKNILSNDFPFQIFLWLTDLFLPDGVLQKILLTLIFFLSGFGMFSLLKRIQKDSVASWGAYFGGILYLFNPFVYSRVIVGQWYLILAYALFPWLLLSLLEAIREYTFWRALRTVLLWNVIFFVNPHGGAMILALMSITLFFVLIFQRAYRWKIFRLSFVIIFLLILVNAYWIIPFLTSPASPALEWGRGVVQRHISSFFTRADPVHGVVWNTLAMYGFWGDEDWRYVPQKIFVPHWFYVFFLIFSLVLWGVVMSIRRRVALKFPFLPYALLTTGIIAFFFALGISFSWTKPLMVWLYDHIPLFLLFREPQKFVALLVFVYAIFGAIGVDDLLRRIERITIPYIRKVSLIAPALFLLIPLVYSPGMFWGFHRQLHVGQYPESWSNVDQFLMRDADDFRVLFLPWHQYIYLAFAQTVIPNPAEYFFQKSTIAGDNIEFGPIYTQNTRPESQYIEREILAKRDKIDDAGKRLASLNIKYIILTRDSDFFNYKFLERQRDIILLFQVGELMVFKNQEWNAP